MRSAASESRDWHCRNSAAQGSGHRDGNRLLNRSGRTFAHGVRQLLKSPGFSVVGHSFAGAGNWREHGDLHVDQRPSAEVAAGACSRAARLLRQGKRRRHTGRVQPRAGRYLCLRFLSGRRTRESAREEISGDLRVCQLPGADECGVSELEPADRRPSPSPIWSPVPSFLCSAPCRSSAGQSVRQIRMHRGGVRSR